MIYFIYNRLSRTPPIAASNSRQLTELIADVCDSNGSVGMMGEVGVGVVGNVRYTTLNAQKQVEREFGFEKLLHQDGNDWEIEKPYMRVYRRSFKCEISGERAKVVVETAAGRVTPKEGLLTGDVKVRIWPQRGGGLGEAVMYLDDIAFVGDKSLFSTAGMVEFVSDDVRLVGTGMKLIYNGDAERLEFLQIERLRSLNIKRWSQGTVFGSSAREKAKTSGEQPGREDKEKAKPGQEYRCVLDSNVVIETPQERLLAEIVSLNNIFVSGGVADDNTVEVAPGSEGAESISDTGGKGDVASAAVELAGDVSISCDGGVVITPMDFAGEQRTEDIAVAMSGEQEAGAAMDEKTTFRGVRIDYNVATGEAVATGPSRITFSAGRLMADVNDKNQGAGGKPFDPSTLLGAGSTQGGPFDGAQGGPAKFVITAQRQVRFEPASNKVVFEGDCRCTVSQAIEDATRRYIVLGDKLEVDLKQADDAEGSASAKGPASSLRGGSSLDIGRLVAAGDVVQLASTKKVGERLLAGVEMKCVRMDYDAVDGNFIATGPGLIKVDNSQTDEPQKGLGRFSLRRKCYAFLRQFDSLKFFGGSNHLVADSKEGSLLVDYLPLVDNDKQEDKVAMTASHVEADILETAQGRMELGALLAKGAVTYEDRDNQFAGGEFVYDANTATIDIRGDRLWPCNFNGAIIDAAKYNVKTGRWNTRIKGPGAIK